jgi:hypothetical protein
MTTSAAAASSLMLPPSQFTGLVSERLYNFLSESLNNLERQVERHREEQYFILDQLIKDGLIEPQLEPSTRNIQRQTTRRYRYHPYHTSSTQRHVEHRRQSLNDSPSSNQTNDEELGKKGNPIYVFDDNEIRCEGCWEEGHFTRDCKSEYRFDGRRYVPIPKGERIMEQTYIIDADYYQQG